MPTFLENYNGDIAATKWDRDLRIWAGRDNKIVITNTGDLAGVSFSCEVRNNSQSTSALFVPTVTPDDIAKTVTIDFSDADTVNLSNNQSCYIVLDATISGEKYPYKQGTVKVRPYGTGLPIDITPVEFEDMKAQLEAIRDEVLAAQSSFLPVGGTASQLLSKIDGVDYNAEWVDPSAGGSVTIADDLVTNQPTQALSAAQGVVLKGLVDAINVVLLSDDATLDDLQEVVDFIKINKTTLDALSIASIAGLQTALDGKATSAQGALADTAVQPGSVVTIYDAAVPAATQVEAEAGTEVGIRRWSPLRIADAIAALASGGVNWAIAQISGVTDGASVNAFEFDTTNDILLGNILMLKNMGVEKFWIDHDGTINFPGGGTLFKTSTGGKTVLENAAGGILHLKFSAFDIGKGAEIYIPAGGRDLKWNRSSGTIDPRFGVRGNTADNPSSPHTWYGQDALSSATTNVDGGDCCVEPGASAIGSGLNGFALFKRTNTSAIPDSRLEASDLCWYLDEVSNKLIFKAKYSDGTTVKTFEIDANP